MSVLYCSSLVFVSLSPLPPLLNYFFLNPLPPRYHRVYWDGKPWKLLTTLSGGGSKVESGMLSAYRLRFVSLAVVIRIENAASFVVVLVFSMAPVTRVQQNLRMLGWLGLKLGRLDAKNR